MALGDITLGTEIEFEAINTSALAAEKMSSTRLLLAWSTGSNCQCCTVDRSGTTLTKNGNLQPSPQNVDAVAVAVLSSTLAVIFYRWGGGEEAQALSVAGNGTLTETGSTLTLAVMGSSMEVIPWDASHVLLLKRGTGSNGTAEIYSVSTSAVARVGTSVDFETGQIHIVGATRIDSTHVLVVWTDASDNASARVLAIDGSFNVTNAGSALEYAPSVNSIAVSCSDLGDAAGVINAALFNSDTIVAAEDQTVRTYQISTSTWAFTAWGSAVVVVADAIASSRSATAFDSPVLTVAATDTSDQGHVATYSLNSTTGALTALSTANSHAAGVTEYFLTMMDAGIYVLATIEATTKDGDIRVVSVDLAAAGGSTGSFSGSGALAAAGAGEVATSASMAGAATVTFTAVAVIAADATMVGDSTAAFGGVGAVAGDAAMAGSSSLSFDAVGVFEATLSVLGTSAFSADAVGIVGTDGVFAGSTTLSASGAALVEAIMSSTGAATALFRSDETPVATVTSKAYTVLAESAPVRVVANIGSSVVTAVVTGQQAKGGS